MDDKKWAKWASLGGVGFVVLNVVGSILQGTPPGADDSNEDVLEWFVDYESGIRTNAFLGALSIILLLWWFGTLWRRMTQAEGNQNRLSVLSLIGLGGSGALFGAATAIWSASAIQVDILGPDAARFYYTMGGTVIGFAGAFLVVHLGATNVLALRTSFLPKWMGVVGVLSALGFLVATTSTMTDADVGMYAGFIGFILWSIWILATSFHMWKTAD